jgi:hypothetical protein
MQCILYKIYSFEDFLICTTNWYAFYMHSYVDKILFLWKVNVTITKSNEQTEIVGEVFLLEDRMGQSRFGSNLS